MVHFTVTRCVTKWSQRFGVNAQGNYHKVLCWYMAVPVPIWLPTHFKHSVSCDLRPYNFRHTALILPSATTRAVWKVRGLTLLVRGGTLCRCGDGLFFEVPPLESNALLTTLNPLLENVLQTVDHFEISCLGAPFSWLEKPRNRMERDLDCMADVLMGFHGSTFSKPNTEFNSDVHRLPREVLRKRDRHRTFTKFRLRVIRWVHELRKRSSYYFSGKVKVK
jgi:hypothetical protein